MPAGAGAADPHRSGRERFLAMRFAAKEAIVKAMGTGFAHGVWIRDVGRGAERLGQTRGGVLGARRARAPRASGSARATSRLTRRAWPGGRGRGAHEGAMNTLVFDIETIPDVGLGRRLHGPRGARRRAGREGDVRAAPPGAPAAISCRSSSIASSRSPARCAAARGSPSGASATCTTGEAELIQRFFDGIEKFSPDLVSWNGAGFDLPVLTTARSLPACRPRATGRPATQDTAFRYNNYLSRYHWRHMDLMDVLSGFQGRGARLPRQHGGAARAARQARLLAAPGLGCVAGRATSPASATTARPTCSTPISSTCASS